MCFGVIISNTEVLITVIMFVLVVIIVMALFITMLGLAIMIRHLFKD